MNFEIWSLLGATLLGLIHVSAASFSFKAQVGNLYTVGSRDEDLKPAGVAARLERASQNYLETFPYFSTCVFLVLLTETSGQASWWGCVLYLFGRAAYLPLYATGVPWCRTISWNFATAGLVLVGLQATRFVPA